MAMLNNQRVSPTKNIVKLELQVAKLSKISGWILWFMVKLWLTLW